MLPPPCHDGGREAPMAHRCQSENTPQPSHGYLAPAAADVKEAVRLCYSEALSAALGKPHDVNAALRVTLTASHPDAAAECGWLAPAAGAGGNRQRRGGRGGWQQQRQQAAAPPDAAPPALTDAVVARLASMPWADFAAACPPSAAQLLPPATHASVQLQARRRPLHVGGRYLKLRRGIPQSPWIIDGQRKGEGSVQVSGFGILRFSWGQAWGSKQGTGLVVLCLEWPAQRLDGPCCCKCCCCCCCSHCRCRCCAPPCAML